MYIKTTIVSGVEMFGREIGKATKIFRRCKIVLLERERHGIYYRYIKIYAFCSTV